MQSDLWYRGVNKQFERLEPGVYRKNFTDRAAKLSGSNLEEKRLRLERDMLSQFRTGGAAFLEGFSRAQIYFTAQHFGMPTRLLDWSTNPLAALFFACDGGGDGDGFVYAMNAKQVIAEDAKRFDVDGEPAHKVKLYQAVMTMRHAFVEYAIGVSFWDERKKNYHSHVLPVRPDAVPGRIGQQSSCFTLHMHLAKPVMNRTLVSIRIGAKSKTRILEELHRVNVNQFTTYYDLDHLSREIRRGWGVKS